MFWSASGKTRVSLSGAVAFYTLLSIIPMLILILIVLSHVVETNGCWKRCPPTWQCHARLRRGLAKQVKASCNTGG